MDFGLNDQVVMITGAGAGICLATAIPERTALDGTVAEGNSTGVKAGRSPACA